MSLLDVAGVHLERSRKWRLHLEEGVWNVLENEALHLDDSGGKFFSRHI